MKQSRRYIALALVALTSALFFGACGGNKQEATTASSSAKTSQSYKMSSSSTKAKTEKKTQSASSEEMKESSETAQVSQSNSEIKKEEQSTPQSKEQEMTEQIDYSQFAGTWVNSEGTTVVITADGRAVLTSGLGTSQYQMNTKPQGEGSIGVNMNAVGGGAGVAVIFTPAGINDENTGADGSQDTLFIGQSFGDPKDLFYRQ